MRIAVFGATGGTGRHVLDQAHQAGDEVRAVVRDPAKLGEGHPGLTVVEADVMDPSAITPVIEGCDAVVSALGSRDSRQPSTVCTDGVTSIVEAMHRVGVRRLVVVSTAGMVTDRGDGPMTKWLVKPILGRVLRHPYDDMRRMEQVVRTSGLDWTIVRPPQLTDGPHTGTYRSSIDLNVRRGFRASRADVADCVLRCLSQRGPVGAVVSMAN